MAKEKYGFVYLWRDRKHNRYYIGCHWGNVNDGYICSSTWMKQAYSHRPQDFRRRILVTNILTKKEMFYKEQEFFNKIKPEEVKNRYYNIHITNNTTWHMDEEKVKSVAERRKGKATYKDADGNKYFLHKDDPKIAELNLVGNNTGLTMSEETKAVMSTLKDNLKKIKLYHPITNEFRKVLVSDKHIVDELLSEGWSETKSASSYEYGKNIQKKIVSEKLTGVKKNYEWTDKQREAARRQQAKIAKDPIIQAKKSAKISALKWFHDPITEEKGRFNECPTGWKSGRGKQENSNGGRTTWNDGIRNYMLKPTDSTEGLVRGMITR